MTAIVGRAFEGCNLPLLYAVLAQSTVSLKEKRVAVFKKLFFLLLLETPQLLSLVED